MTSTIKRERFLSETEEKISTNIVKQHYGTKPHTRSKIIPL